MIVMIVMIVMILPARQLRKVRGCFQGDCDDDENDDVSNHCDNGNGGRKQGVSSVVVFLLR